MIISSCQTLSLPEPGSDYVGDVSVTASGRKCQNWLDQTPHKHDFAHLGNHNSCRNLDFGNDEAPLGAWCYTTDPNIRWEFCSQIPECPKDNGNNIQVNVQCGLLEEHFEAKWGHNSVTTVGHPSRLNSKGDILKPRSSRRNRRSNGRLKPVSWLDMIKNRDIYNGKRKTS